MLRCRGARATSRSEKNTDVAKTSVSLQYNELSSRFQEMKLEELAIALSEEAVFS